MADGREEPAPAPQVALLQNSQTRSDQAIQHKLNALADGLADVMAYLATGSGQRDLKADMQELRAAVGLEDYGSTTRNNKEDSGARNGARPLAHR